MAPSPGTPLGGERPRQRSHSPRGGAALHDPMDTDGGQPSSRGRVFCPEPGCLQGDPLRARGWASVASMQSHIDAHLAGSLHGDVPIPWLHSHNRTRCLECGLSVSSRHGIHPTCRAAARAAAGAPRSAAAGDTLPSLDAILLGRTRTLRHVLAAARYLWGKVLTRALAAAAHHNDIRAWQELLMLPQAVLAAPQRGGRKHAKAVAAYTLDRLQRWESGERAGLWESRRPPLPPSGRERTANQRKELATGLAREGFDSKACAALLADGLCAETPATIAALQQLHPTQPNPAVPPFHELCPGPLVEPDMVAKALRSFPAASAPGPSGLRVQHLRDACSPGTIGTLHQHLAAVVALLANGQACEAVAPVLCGAHLVAVPKPKGGVRPIAIGELLRRLTGKCLMSQLHTSARQHFFPAQVGVAVSGGAEAAVHAVRAWLDRHSHSQNKVLLKLDFENAFNTISRDHVLSAVRSHFPALARWTAWCYGTASSLQFGTTILQSACGVQQGDPLGPLLFAAALQPLAEELRSGPLDLATFYLDDGVIAGDIDAVSAALSHTQARCAELGLRLNLAKCEIIKVGLAHY